MATSPHRATDHHKLSDVEAMDMAIASLETARRSLHPGFAQFRIMKSPASSRRWADRWSVKLLRLCHVFMKPWNLSKAALPESLIIGAALGICVAGMFVEGVIR